MSATVDISLETSVDDGILLPDAVFSLGIDIQVDAGTASKLYREQVGPTASRKVSGELLVGIHREISCRVCRLSTPDLPVFREVGTIVDKWTGDDVEVAIMIEVRCRLTPAVVKVVQRLLAEVDEV